MKKISVFLIMFLILIGCGKRENKPEFGIITFYSGQIKININGKISKPKLKLILRDNDTVITGDKSRLDIQLGNFGIIRVNQNSEIQMRVILKNVKNYLTKLKTGEILCNLKKLKKNQEFNVETPTAVAGVRGTTFLVKSKEDKSEIAVADGKVEVASKKEPEKKSIVTKNQSAQITKISKLPKVLKNLNLSDLKKLKNFKKTKIIKNIKSIDLKSLKKLKGFNLKNLKSLLPNKSGGKNNTVNSKKIDKLKTKAAETKNKVEKKSEEAKKKADELKNKSKDVKKKADDVKSKLKKKFGF